MNEDKKYQWMPIGEAAKYLGISRDTLRRWGKRGKIKAVRSPTNRRYYTKKQLDKIMSTGKEEKKVNKLEKKLSINKTQKLIITGILSFLVTAALALLTQFFLLK